MKNITIALPDEVYRAARIRAAERDTSVSALVGDYLRRLSRSDDFIALEQLQQRVHAELPAFRGADRLGRDELHDRAVR